MGTLKLLVQQFIIRKPPHGYSSTRRHIVISTAFALLITSKVLMVQVPLIFKKIVDSLSLEAHFFIFTLGIWTITRLAAIVSGELRNVLFSVSSQSIIKDVQHLAYQALTNPLTTLHLPAAALLKTLERGTKAIQSLTSSTLMNVVPTFLETGLVIGLLFSHFDISIAAMALVAVAAYSIITIFISERRLVIRAAMNKAETQTAATLMETVGNKEMIHTAPGASALEALKFERLLKKYERASLRTYFSLAALNGIQGLIVTVAVAGMLGSAQNMTPGDIVLLHGLIFQLAAPLNFLGVAYREGRQAIADIETMFMSLPKPSFASTAASFSLKEVLCKRRIAVVGSSGGGKSTLARALAMELGEQGIWVPQDVSQLFAASVEYNIAYPSLLAKTLDPNVSTRKLEKQVLKAMAAVKLSTEMRLREIGERGSLLSGGERQRILLARALVRLYAESAEDSGAGNKETVLVLDEPTAWLDAVTEVAVIEELFKAAGSRPVVIVTHSLRAIVPMVDWIVVVGPGMKILEQGTYQELLARKGSFATLYAADGT